MKIRSVALLFMFITLSFAKASAQNYYLGFDGINDHVSLPASVQPSGNAFSAEAWIYIDPSGGGDQKILMNLTWGGGCKGFGMSIYKNSGLFTYCGALYASGSAYFTPNSAPIPTNTWTHIALTWHANDSLHIYVNGKLEGSTYTGSSTYSNSGVNTYMGSGDGAGWAPFKGQIDEVRVWSAERTPNELINNLNSDFAGNEAGLSAYYKMSNGSGTTLSDNKSGGSNNGTLYNGASWLSGHGLPLHFEAFTGKATTEGNVLQWTTSNEYLNKLFEIQRSADGMNFTVIGTLPSQGNSGGLQYYSFTDLYPMKGKNIYRVSQIDIDGGAKCTPNLNLYSLSENPGLIIFSNPSCNGMIEFNIDRPGLVQLFNSSGVLVTQQYYAAGRQLMQAGTGIKGMGVIKANGQSRQVIIR